MGNYIGTVKTTTTLYLDELDGYWNDEKPEGKCGIDYYALKKGSKLNAYYLEGDEKEYVEGTEFSVKVKTKHSYILFEDLEQMINIGWFNLLCAPGYWFNKIQEIKKG